MGNTKPKKRHIVWARYGFKNLLIWLFVYLVLGPFLEPLRFAHIAMSSFLTMALFSAIYAVNKEGETLPFAVVLLVIALGLLWLGQLNIIHLTPVWLSIAMILYLGTLAYSFLRFILRVKKVDSNVISASLCLYLVIGMFWGALYHLLESLVPGSFAGALLKPDAHEIVTGHYLNYFSFVTLSTLGYGDILPQTQAAAALCGAEAILGQFFTVVLVARLVGIQVAQEVTVEVADEVANEVTADKERGRTERF